ncbi:MAG: 50S ribosomal protein L32e [Candidatus Aenigmarchaeota archaeon]|nr:50S ribosomal protein L32e [Candidatus Aenigmarchaeota archaeon]
MRITKKPKFIRSGGKNRKKVGEKWRRPRGRTNKLRQHKKNRGRLPHPGYGTPATLRGLHPSGLEEVLIANVTGMENYDKEKQALRIEAKVGALKRIEIQKKAEELGIRILNPKKIEAKKPKLKKEVKLVEKKEEVTKAVKEEVTKVVKEEITKAVKKE